MEERQQERIQEKLQQRWGIRSFAGFPDFFLIFMCDLCYSGTEMHEDVCCTHRRNEIDDLNNRKLAASFAEEKEKEYWNWLADAKQAVAARPGVAPLYKFDGKSVEELVSEKKAALHKEVSAREQEYRIWLDSVSKPKFTLPSQAVNTPAQRALIVQENVRKGLEKLNEKTAEYQKWLKEMEQQKHEAMMEKVKAKLNADREDIERREKAMNALEEKMAAVKAEEERRAKLSREEVLQMYRKVHNKPLLIEQAYDYGRVFKKAHDLECRAARYFECLASGLPVDGGQAAAAQELDMSLDEVEAIINDLFKKYDQDGSQFLDPSEFKALMSDLQQRLDFPKNEILLFLAEADMNADGKIEYEEFIPLALQIIQGMYAKKRLEQHLSDVDLQAEELLVHGMSREELTALVGSMFERMDEDHSGILNKQEFVAALTSMELGLTRREINAIMFQVDQDRDGNVSYREFVPFAFDLLQKMASLRLLETELENDELAQYILDLFKAKDTEMTGMLGLDEMRDLLHQAMLGLTRMQIYTVLSEAEVNADNMISYSNFVPRAVGLIRSMLSFEKAIVKNDTSAQDEEKFYAVLDEAYAGTETLGLPDFMQRLEQSSLLDSKELDACHRMLGTTYAAEELPVEEAKSQVWALVKSLRRARAA
ncbi:Calmodulin-like protein 12 (Touch-induced calmodulin-related protein 3) [Durusdinium trenchii]|uniref:Calmodulin-like protein 12 (Touch-induced calmodulin-related protein 3) n=1 Tax=Durusdinium trenchii TaxID=1381693 RepID=A0ABP0IAH3_9DINO